MYRMVLKILSTNIGCIFRKTIYKFLNEPSNCVLVVRICQHFCSLPGLGAAVIAIFTASYTYLYVCGMPNYIHTYRPTNACSYVRDVLPVDSALVPWLSLPASHSSFTLKKNQELTGSVLPSPFLETDCFYVDNTIVRINKSADC